MMDGSGTTGGGGTTEGGGTMEGGGTTKGGVARRECGEKECLVACYSHCSSLVGFVTPPDSPASSFVGLSTHLSCHSSRGFDFGWEMVGACVHNGCGKGTATVGGWRRGGDILSWIVGSSRHPDERRWQRIPRGAGRGQINGQRCYAISVQQERGSRCAM